MIEGEDVVAALSLSGLAERFTGAATEGLVEEMARVAQAFAGEVMGADHEVTREAPDQEAVRG